MMIYKKLVAVIVMLVIYIQVCNAQENGILTFTGIKYFKGGIWAKKLDVTLNGKTWTSNRLPIQTEFIIKLEEPSGFKKDEQGKFFPAVELLIMGEKKDTLGYVANMFKDNEGIGMDEFSLNNLELSLGFNDKTKPGDLCFLFINFFDLKSKNKLRMEFPVIIAPTLEPLDNTSFVYSAKSFTGYEASATGVEINSVEAYLDSTFLPKSLYHSIRVPEIKGVTTYEINEGSYKLWIYDKQMDELKPPKEPGYYVAKTKKDIEDMVNILIKIPLVPSDKNNKDYTVRYRWESKDRNKIVDVVSRFLPL